MPELHLVPIYLADRHHMLDRLSVALERTFLTKVRIRKPWFDPEVSFDKLRGQYNSTILLKLLLDDPAYSSGKALGVVGMDLFAPVLTYVFGEAQLDGRASVVSLHRLRPEVYGLTADDHLLFTRLLKESTHELGHCFGLLHCTDTACVMHASTYVEEIDVKSEWFCQSCQTTVRSTAG